MSVAETAGVETEGLEVLVEHHRDRRDRALVASMLSGALAKLLVTGFGVMAVAITVRSVGEAQFGVLATLSTLTGLMAFADLGIGSGLMTFLAVASGREDEVEARRMVSNAAFGMIIMGGAVALAGTSAAFIVPWGTVLGASDLARGTLQPAVALFFILTGLTIPSGIGQRVLVGHQQGLIANLWLVGAAALSLGGTGVAAIAGAPLWVYVLTAAGIPVCLSFAQSVFVFTVLRPELRPKPSFVSRASLRSLAGVSGMFFGLNIAMAVSFQSDAVIVASTRGATSAAVFAIALRMFTLISGTLSTASQQMWTSMAEALARGDVDWVRSRLVRVVFGTLAVSAPASLVLVLLGQILARLWVGAQLVPPISLLVAFALWTVYSLAIAQVGLFLNAAHIVGPQLVMALLMSVANVGLSLVLTHWLGLIGPILGSLTSHVLLTGIPTVVLAVKALRRSADSQIKGLELTSVDAHRRY